MSRAMHLLLLLTVTTLAVNPLVACCLSGAPVALATSAQDNEAARQVQAHAAESVASVPEDGAAALPPCHRQPGAATERALEKTAQGPTAAVLALCPGCLDCDSSALVPPGIASPAKDRPAADGPPLPELQPLWAAQWPPALTRNLTSGRFQQPGRPPAPRPATTQVSLQQLLLI